MMALTLALVLAAAPCSGERVVLLPFQPVALATAEAREAEDVVRRAAEALPGLCLEPRADTVAKLRARGGRLAGCTDAACRGAQVLALGADRVLRGVALGVGGGRDVALTLVDREGLESYATVALSSREGSRLDETRVREVFGGVWAGRSAPREVKAPVRIWPGVVLGLGGAVLATGVGLGLAARRTEASVSSGTGGCTGEGEALRTCFEGRLRQGRQQTLAANVLLGAGSVLGVGGTLLFFWEWP